MYKLLKTGFSTEPNCVSTQQEKYLLTIPFDPANTDYANFKKDLADGAELQDADGVVIDGIAYLEELV
jgi:hypothetical protein